MGRWKKEEQDLLQSEQRRQLMEDVREAEREWNLARMRFEDALGHDHVDYAIFSLEAAEKKLDMLLRKAKLHWKSEDGAAEKEGKHA